MSTGERARSLWVLGEPLHALAYFAPEVADAAAAAGMRGFWAGYFGMRAAPLGAVPAAVVVATFHGFAPDFVARRVPAVWDDVSPAQALAARQTGVHATLRRVLGAGVDGPEVAEAAALAGRAAAAVDPAGRPLAAGEAALGLPGVPVLDLWQALTVLREHRGDGHVAALTVHGLDGLAAHVLHCAVSGTSRDWLLRARGWTAEQWDAAVDRLTDRGLLGADGPTAAGHDLRADVEDTTDRLAAPPWAELTAAEAGRLGELLAPLRTAVVAAGLFPAGNPIGVPAVR